MLRFGKVDEVSRFGRADEVSRFGRADEVSRFGRPDGIARLGVSEWNVWDIASNSRVLREMYRKGGKRKR